MKDLFLDGQNLKLSTDYVKHTRIDVYGEESVWLPPSELLQLRDWINERVRELQFQGYLPDSHIGD